MATQKLQVIKTITDGVQYGIKNVASLILMVVLYIVTVWIPYLNVGTTIGLYKAIIKIGRGEIVNPVGIFASENRKNLGDFFLLQGFITIGSAAAAVFMFFPAAVIGIAWGFAIYFFIDKGLSPHKCLKVSYKVTDGEKWTIFWIYVILGLAASLLSYLFMQIPKVGWLFAIIVTVICVAVIVAVEGVMYAHFAAKADEMFADKIGGCGCNKGAEAPAEAAAPAEPAAPAAPEAPAPEAPAEPAPEAPKE